MRTILNVIYKTIENYFGQIIHVAEEFAEHVRIEICHERLRGLL